MSLSIRIHTCVAQQLRGARELDSRLPIFSFAAHASVLFYIFIFTTEGPRPEEPRPEAALKRRGGREQALEPASWSHPPLVPRPAAETGVASWVS